MSRKNSLKSGNFYYGGTDIMSVKNASGIENAIKSGDTGAMMVYAYQMGIKPRGLTFAELRALLLYRTFNFVSAVTISSDSGYFAHQTEEGWYFCANGRVCFFDAPIERVLFSKRVPWCDVCEVVIHVKDITGLSLPRFAVFDPENCILIENVLYRNYDNGLMHGIECSDKYKWLKRVHLLQ